MQIASKRYSGDLSALSTGHMLALRTAVEGSAGYVAIEVVVGELNGRQGSFTLQHSGAMDRGEATLDLTIIADSGTDELEGISGSGTITQTPDGHTYTVTYEL